MSTYKPGLGGQGNFFTFCAPSPYSTWEVRNRIDRLHSDLRTFCKGYLRNEDPFYARQIRNTAAEIVALTESAA
jgi:hypothetical protein